MYMRVHENYSYNLSRTVTNTCMSYPSLPEQIKSFNNYLQSTYSVPDIILDPGEVSLNSWHRLVDKTDNKQYNI